MSKSPRKAQWGMQQHQQRRDPSPLRGTGGAAQWDASITLRAVQSESLQMRNSSNVPKYPPSPKSTTFPSSSSSSLHSSRPGTMTNVSSSMGSSTNTSNGTSLSHTKESIGQSCLDSGPTVARPGLQKNQNGFHSYSLSVDTAKAQQQFQPHPQTALGLFRSIEATSPTSTAEGPYHYWRGGDSPALIKGNEPPLEYAERRPSWTLEHVSSTRRAAPHLSPNTAAIDHHHHEIQQKNAESRGNAMDATQMIEQEAKELMLLRSGSNKKMETGQIVKPLRVSSRHPQGATDYSAKSSDKIRSQCTAEKVRFDDSRPTIKRTSSQEPTSSPSRTSFFKKAFGVSSSPQKRKDKVVKVDRRTSSRQHSNSASPRSIVRNSHSASSLRQMGRQGNTLSRMISAPTLVETSSTASPVQGRSEFLPSPSPRSRAETLENAQKEMLTVQITDDQPKRRKRAPPPPPPRRKYSTNSSFSATSRSPTTPISPSTPPEENSKPAVVAYYDDDDGIDGRKDSLSTIGRNPSLQLTEDFSMIGQIPLDFISGVGKERKLSNTESLASIYDQESWLGHTPQGNETSLPLSNYQPSKLGPKNRGINKNDLSPLVKDSIVELQEPDSSRDEAESSKSEGRLSHLVHLEDINEQGKAKFSQFQDDKRASVYEDADSGFASNEESISSEDESISPIIVKRRPFTPKYYKIVRTTDEDSKEMEFLDSIYLYEEEEEEEESQSIDHSIPDSLDRFNTSLTTAEQEEIHRFVKTYGKNIRSVRASVQMDLEDANKKSLPIEKVWQERQEGKRGVLSFLLASISSTMNYLTPIKFRDIHQIRQKHDSSSYSQLEQFHMESLKDNSERLFLASVPMYEMLLQRLWHISHWTKKLQSLGWCLTYFSLWYFGALFSGAFAILILKIFNERKSGKKRGTLLSLEELQARSQILERFSKGKSDIVKPEHTTLHSSVTSSPTLACDENDFTSSTIVLLCKHTEAISNGIAKIADIHERMYNMFRWSHTPATNRTLILMTLFMLMSFFINASQVLSCLELIFGIHFFLLVPILSRIKYTAGKETLFPFFSFFDFILSGVPNDAQNALLIMRKGDMSERSLSQSQDEIKGSKDDNDYDEIVIQPAHARGQRFQSKEEIQQKMTWAAKETTFSAKYHDSFGFLTITSERLTFKTGSPSFEVLFDIALEQIAQLDKIRKGNVESSIHDEGLRLTVKQDQKGNSEQVISIHTFLNMNLRDEVFNRILALAPQRWHKQVGISDGTA